MNKELFLKVKNQNLELIKLQKKLTMGKVALTHLLAGIGTLLYCPQFGLDPFGVGHGLAHFFMSYGDWACGLFCGAFFYGSGSLMSQILLSKRDLLYFSVQNFRKSLILVSSFHFILMFIAKMTTTELVNFGLEFSLFWVLGALTFQGLANFAAKPRLYQY
jgi:hypothetical protein